MLLGYPFTVGGQTARELELTRHKSAPANCSKLWCQIGVKLRRFLPTLPAYN
jgi:hypothetical protein